MTEARIEATKAEAAIYGEAQSLVTTVSNNIKPHA